jgi:hypothetical protein
VATFKKPDTAVRYISYCCIVYQCQIPAVSLLCFEEGGLAIGTGNPHYYESRLVDVDEGVSCRPDKYKKHQVVA